MAINYDWYKNPKITEEEGIIKFHPRIHYNGSTTTAEMRRYIQNSCRCRFVGLVPLCQSGIERR